MAKPKLFSLNSLGMVLLPAAIRTMGRAIAKGNTPGLVCIIHIHANN